MAANLVYKLSAAGQYTQLATWNSQKAGGYATGGLAMDAAGNIYGTTNPVNGGIPGLSPLGAVFKVNSVGGLILLYIFPGPPTAGLGEGYGNNPGLVVDAAGNLYGATPNAGLGGTLYKVSTAGKRTTLYGFAPAPGGTSPFAGVIGDSAGNLYGTTYNGGSANAGVVYKMTPSGHEIVLYAFTGGGDGRAPGPVTRDSAGNLYGTTKLGGSANQGVVYKLDPTGHETVLHSFTGGADGGLPNGVVPDSAGNLYGTTFAGGSASQTLAQEGVVFKLDPTGQETVLYSFTGLADGGVPVAGVILDPAGNLYGTTNGGGLGLGVVFEINTAGQYSVLYSFTGSGGGNPFSGVIRDSAGNLYGTAANYGPRGEGVVYKLAPGGQYTVLYAFAGGGGGQLPDASVVRDGAGNLYGTTYGGGAGCGVVGCGVVYKLDANGTYTILHTFTGGAELSNTR